MMPELSLDKNMLKETLKTAILEIIPENHAKFQEFLAEVVEDIALTKAIEQGEKTKLFNTEVLDFLRKHPTPREILDFKTSPQAQERPQQLLAKNKEEALTQKEIAELDVYEKLEHLMILLKADSLKAIS